MAPIVRKKEILQALSDKGMITISMLADELKVSHMTIRRDISKMEQEGLVIRHHGIVELATDVQVNRIFREPSREQKSALCQSEKVGIATLAVAEVENGMSIYLDAGTTTQEIARQLTLRRDLTSLTVITNDFAIAALLMKHSSFTLYHTGGRVDAKNESCVGEQTARMLEGLIISKAFISASSWDLNGITTPNEAKIVVKRTLIEKSRRAYLVTDSSKFNTEAMFSVFALSRFEKIFTDRGLPGDAIEQIRQLGVLLVQAVPEAAIAS